MLYVHRFSVPTDYPWKALRPANELFGLKISIFQSIIFQAMTNCILLYSTIVILGNIVLWKTFYVSSEHETNNWGTYAKFNIKLFNLKVNWFRVRCGSSRLQWNIIRSIFCILHCWILSSFKSFLRLCPLPFFHTVRKNSTSW